MAGSRNAAGLAAPYARARARLAPGRSIAVLAIGAESTRLALGTGAEPELLIELELGSRRTAREFFRGAPPGAAELEQAIAGVEDRLVPAATIEARGVELFAMGPGVTAIARLAAGGSDARAGQDEARADEDDADRAPGAIRLSREAVERSFDRLASVALGRPAASAGIPANGEFAARLLILRELMHHLGFEAITVLR